MAIHAVTVGGEQFSRVWRCAEPLTEDATADRIRWQLDGWLNRRNPGDRPTGPIATLRLEPVEVISAAALQLTLWGAGDDDRSRARRALLRVQGLLGPEAVQVSVKTGLNMDRLIQRLNEMVLDRVCRLHLRIPQSRQDLVSLIHREGKILNQRYEDNDILLTVVAPRVHLHVFQPFLDPNPDLAPL